MPTTRTDPHARTLYSRLCPCGLWYSFNSSISCAPRLSLLNMAAHKIYWAYWGCNCETDGPKSFSLTVGPKVTDLAGYIRRMSAYYKDHYKCRTCGVKPTTLYDQTSTSTPYSSQAQDSGSKNKPVVLSDSDDSEELTAFITPTAAKKQKPASKSGASDREGGNKTPGPKLNASLKPKVKRAGPPVAAAQRPGSGRRHATRNDKYTMQSLFPSANVTIYTEADSLLLQFAVNRAMAAIGTVKTLAVYNNGELVCSADFLETGPSLCIYFGCVPTNATRFEYTLPIIDVFDVSPENIQGVVFLLPGGNQKAVLQRTGSRSSSKGPECSIAAEVLRM